LLIFKCIIIKDIPRTDWIDWDYLFKILTKSSPTSLFKFKMHFVKHNYHPIFESFKLFFDNWKGRYPMLLQTQGYCYDEILLNLTKKYMDKGIVKSYDIFNDLWVSDNFEWI
jgi:hypothetical protein